MGENVAPSPQNGRGRKRKRPPRRKNAAPKAAMLQQASANGAVRPEVANASERVAKRNAQGNDPALHRNWLERTAYAALDLGTNNCRLLIARAGGDDFTVVDAFSRVVRLGEGMTSTGRMSEEAMDRAVEALGVCAV